MLEEYAELFLNKPLEEVDPGVAALIRHEEERQARKIILIPSESIAPLPVREALGSVFTNLYAEGYPPVRMLNDPEELLLDLAHQLSYIRRYADRRFYKGVEYVDILEALAQRRIAECFANENAKADEIFVNIQPLSGAAANLAVYDAFLEPGDVVMGMDLMHGGHLTHGSRFNFSGKRYRVVSYTVDPTTELLDYDQIMDLAKKYRPKLIIAGYTSYPWAPDWEKFREIADAVGAILLADIAHTAGMVIGGVYPNPVGIADVVTFTTHKTICGPRGACILTTDEGKAQRIDSAVFPGAQGGPHVNKFAAIAVAFKIAQTEAFKRLQRRIVENARHLAEALKRQGVRLAYGGTDTHIVMVDLKSIPTKNGKLLRGEPAARILDLAGIVVNRNTIPGDTVTALATGIRLGTPWVSQRGMGKAEMEKIAELIWRVLSNIKPFSYQGLHGELPQGKIELEVLEEVKREVEELVGAGEAKGESESESRPRRARALARARAGAREAGSESESESEPGPASPLLLEGLDLDLAVLRVYGERAVPFLQEATTGDIASLAPGECARTAVLERDGTVLDDLLVLRDEPDRFGRDRFILVANGRNLPQLVAHLRGLSDGYIIFDDEDLLRKVEGPVVIEEAQLTGMVLHGPGAEGLLRGVLAQVQAQTQAEGEPLRLDEGRWARINISAGAGSAGVIVARPPWDEADPKVVHLVILARPEEADRLRERLTQAGAVPAPAEAGSELYRALRGRIGLPDYRNREGKSEGEGESESKGESEDEGEGPLTAVELYRRCPGLFKLTKPYFVGQKHLAPVMPKVEKKEFHWDGHDLGQKELRRTPLYEEHLRLGAKLVEFAGWEMPVWYTSISEEHRAVREAAGLFDVGHMGVLEVAGEGAPSFLDLVTTNYIRWLEDGQSQYTYMLDPDGRVIDDLIVYRRRRDRYLLVVNAINAEKDLAWLLAASSGEYLLDRERPWVEPDLAGPVKIRDLKDPAAGDDRRIDLALQGPSSLRILQAIAQDGELRRRLARLRRGDFIECELGGIEVLIARTGYTGEELGYELLVHPDRAARLWRLLLEAGEPLGLKPAGLGARDSTRTEAGLPLWGHELAGELDISPIEAGFAAYVKFHKPFFVGRAALLAQAEGPKREVIRFQIARRGVRPPKPGDPVVDGRGRYLGRVTSCAPNGEGVLIGMACVERGRVREGDPIAVFPLSGPSGSGSGKPPWELGPGERTLLPVEAEVLPRFAIRRAVQLHLACQE